MSQVASHRMNQNKTKNPPLIVTSFQTSYTLSVLNYGGYSSQEKMSSRNVSEPVFTSSHN